MRSNSRGADHGPRGWREQGVEGDHLGAGEELVERHQLDLAPVIEHRVVGDDTHAESRAPARYRAADAAQADYPQHRAG